MSKSAQIIKEKRKELGWRQHEVAGWIQNERSNYCRKENGQVPFTADEFLELLAEFEARGPRKKELTLKALLKLT